MPRVSPSSPTPVWLGRLTLELKRLAAPVLASRRRGLLSLSFEVPLPPQTVPAQAQGEWFFWHRPAQGHRLLGLGLAGRITAAGRARFQALARAVALARSHWTFIHQGRASPLARAFLGFAFDPDHQPGGDWQGFPNLAFLVPQVLLEWRDGGDCTITFNHDCGLRLSPERVIATWSAQLRRLLETESEVQGAPPRLMSARQVPAPGQWQAQVSDALAAIRQERLEKVVLSRTLELAFGGAPAPGRRNRQQERRWWRPPPNACSVCMADRWLATPSPVPWSMTTPGVCRPWRPTSTAPWWKPFGVPSSSAAPG